MKRSKVGPFAFAIGLVVVYGVHPDVTAELPVGHKVKILMTVLSYDQKLQAKCGPEIQIGLIYRVGHGKSEQEARSLRDTIQAGAAKKINGLPIKVRLVGLDSAGGAEGAFKQHELDILYICFGFGDMLSSILDGAGRLRLLTMTGQKKYVKAGVAVGVAEEEGRAKILVNPEAVKAQGSEFDPRLLRLAKLVY